jgi:hypothetical protein
MPTGTGAFWIRIAHCARLNGEEETNTEAERSCSDIRFIKNILKQRIAGVMRFSPITRLEIDKWTVE